MWTCKYHIVFAPKYRRKIIYKKIREDIIHIFKELCKRKGVEIIAGECCSDHVHMLISIPPKYSVSEVMGYLKGKSSLMVFERHANLKYKYGNRHFWCRGYYVDTVGKNAKKIFWLFGSPAFIIKCSCQRGFAVDNAIRTPNKWTFNSDGLLACFPKFVLIFLNRRNLSTF